MTDRVGLEISARPARGKRRDEDEPLRVLVLSELSGIAATRAAADFRPRRVSIDNFDALFAAIRPALALDPADSESGEAMHFESLDGLHPDSLAARLPNIGALRALQARLGNSATEANALKDLAALTGQPRQPDATPAAGATAAAPSGDGGAGGQQDDDMFSRLLGRARSGDDPQQTKARQVVQSLISGALENAGDTGSSTSARDAAAEITALMNESMRASLQAPPFRQLERAWRGLHWLVSRVDEAEGEIHVVDTSKAELSADIAANRETPDASGFSRLMATDEGWDLIVADYSFGLDADDLLLLATLGAISGRAHTPLVAHGDLALAGCRQADAIDSPWDWALPDDDIGRLWREVRGHPAAAWIALAAPRFLLRHPYGRRTDPIEGFEFEELPARPSKEAFLWGNPAFACALLMIRAHADGEAHWPAPVVEDIDDLPTPVYDDGTGDAIQPGVEFLLGERACATAEQAGLVTFASGRNTTRMRTSGIRPLAS